MVERTTFAKSKLRDALERGDPRVKESRERFETVFRGTGLVSGEGGGGSSGGGGSGSSTQGFTASPSALRQKTQAEIRATRTKDLSSRVATNTKQGRSEFFGLTNADLTFLRSENARNIRGTARREGRNISTPVRELQEINRQLGLQEDATPAEVSKVIREKQNEARLPPGVKPKRIDVIKKDTFGRKVRKRETFLPTGSASQKFFELFGVEFFKPGERDRIINNTLKNFTTSQTSEEQQKAIDQLREVGINITEVTEGNETFFEIKPEELEALAPTSKAGNFVIGLGDAFAKGSLFASAFSVGGTQRGKARVKAKAKQKTVKKAPKQITDKIVKVFEDKFKTQGQNAVQKDLLELSKRIDKQVVNKQLARDNLKFLLDNLQKKGIIKDFVLNEKTGQVSFIGQQGLATPTAFVRTKAKPTVVIDVTVPSVPKIKGTAETTASTGSLRSSTQNRIGQKIVSLNKELATVKQNQKQNISQLQKFLLQSKEAQLTKQIQKQVQRQRQVQKLVTAQATSQATAQKTRQKSKFKTIQATVPRFKFKPRTTKPRPKIRFPPPFKFLKGDTKKRRKPQVPFPIGKVGYNAFAKQRGKLIKISKIPTTKKKARDISAFFVDRTLSATGFIKKTDKKAFKPKFKVPTNYFSNNKAKFRTFKISKGKRVPFKNTFIEKRKFRLDKKNETQTIQQLKRRLLKPKFKTSMMFKVKGRKKR